MKKFTLFFSALLFSMMSFAGVVTFDADADKGNAGTDSNNAAAYTITKGGVTVEVSSGILGTYNNEMHYRIYKNQTLKITSTAGNITSVEFTCTGNGSEKYGPGCFTVDGGDYTYAEAVGTWTGSATEITFTAATNQVRATQIVVTIDGEVGETPDQPEEPETPVTPENPEGVITCAEAVAICEATGETATTETYTIRGYVTEIKEAYTDQYKNVSCWMADEKGGGQVFLAFRVKPINAADQAVKVNDYIEVKGALVNYYGNTPETTAGGSMTIITAGEGGTTPEQPETPSDLVGDGTAENPYTVEDVLALNNTSKGPHYVKGFIIGQVNGASISSGLDTEAPFEGSTNSDGSVATQGTNLIIASVMGETTKIVAVQLPKGELRDAFNLVENPDMLGKEVLICGNLEKYFGVPGIKSPTSIEVIGGDNGDVVNVTGLQYADAYYMEEEGVAYWDIQMYNVDETGEYDEMPIVFLGVEAKSKTALNGTYDLLLALYGNTLDEETYEVDGVYNDETIAATLTIKNVDNEGNYSFVGSFVGEDGKTYKINTISNVYALDDATEEVIELKEEGTDEPGDDPVTPPAEGVITCAEAVAICEATGETSTTETYTIRGYVTEIKTAYSEQYGNISFWMADTPDGGKVLQGYRVKPVNEADINVAVGDYVEVVGTLVNFMSNTPEVNAGGTYTIVTAGEDNNNPVTPPTTDGAVTFDADVDQGNAGTDSNNAAAYTITKSGVTMEVSSGILGTYNNEMHYRVYKNQTLTLTSTVGKIVKVEFTCTANGEEKYGPGCFTVDGGEYTYAGAVGTWTGSASEITFTASTNQVRATQVVVTLESTGTGVEDVVTVEVPVKVIENGQLMIIRGENVYNVLGAQVK